MGGNDHIIGDGEFPLGKLKETEEGSSVVEDSLLRIKEIGYSILDAVESGNFDEFGRLCDEHWQNKMKLSHRIAIPGISTIKCVVRRRCVAVSGILTSKCVVEPCCVILLLPSIVFPT